VSIRILSPGDDGDLTQSIANTVQSIAKTVNDTVQQATQTVVQPPAIAPVVPTVPIEPFVPLATPQAAATGLVLSFPALLLAPVGATIQVLGDEAAVGIAVIPALQDENDRRHHVASPPAATTSAFPAPPPARAAEPAEARPAAAPAQARPSQRRPTQHQPLRHPRDPVAPPAPVSVAAAASGPGSSGGVGIAILVGALLAASPQTARWLRTVRARRHRAPVSRRPERPG